MVAHKRIPKEINREESQHRKQRYQKVRKGKKWRPAPPLPEPPEQQHKPRRPYERQERRRLGRANFPPRINEAQRMRPDQLAEIKPNYFAGNDESFRPCLLP